MFSTLAYRKCPIWLQERLLSARGALRSFIREGADFRKVSEEIRATQWYNTSQLQALQLERIKMALTHAARHVPYYVKLFKEQRINVDDLRDVKDITRISYLTKATVLSNWQDLIATNLKGARASIHTSGSTGSPLRLLQTREAVVRQNAFIHRQLEWAGYRQDDRRAWIRGDMIVPIEQRMPPYWRYNRSQRMLMMSSYHLGSHTADDYVKVLERFDPMLIQAYPSSVVFLARFLKATSRQYRGRSLRAIVTGSETLSEVDRQMLVEQMGCQVFDQYNSAERVSLIQTCEHGQYHIASDYAFTELVPLDGGRYEVVGTGFNNLLMPLIRYRLGDVVELASEVDGCRCGRQLPMVKKVIGRMDDYVRTPDGRYVGRLSNIFKGIKNLAMGQIVQESLEGVTIRIVPFAGFDRDSEQKLLKLARERLGADMVINIQLVSDIPRSASGKFKLVISKLNTATDDD